MAAARLNAPNGAAVTVDSSKVDGLLARGFTTAEAPKAAAKKASSSKSKK